MKITRKQQAANTKKKLMEISMNLIAKYGFDNVTINQICEEANVSIGAFYHHLGSKTGIIIEGYDECDAYFEDVISNLIEDKSYFDLILEYIGFQMQYAVDSGVDFMIQLYRAQLANGNEFFLSEDRSLVKGLYYLINRALEEKELEAEIDCKQIGNEVLIITRGLIFNWCQCEGSFNLRKKADIMVRNYLYVYQYKK